MRMLSYLSPIVALVAGAFLLPTAPVFAGYVMLDGAEITEGQMRIVRAERERLETEPGEARTLPRPTTDRFVLKETRVEVEISGVLARVRLEQVFQNPHADRLEALYVFPLPENAAVDGYSFQVGETVIQGVVKKRAEARQEYEKARDEGRKGALLEEERANIFSQAVANIPPNGEIRVHIEYVHPVKIDGAGYVFRFPMVVGPRYIPGQPVARPNLGRGWANDTAEVPDASRITPAVLPAGMRHGNDVFIHVTIDAAMPIQRVTAVTHELDITQPTETTAEVRLKNSSTIANKDFVVEYRLAGERTVLGSLAHKDENATHGYLALVLQPKREVTVAEVTRREVVLVLDRSGSMNGTSISQLRIMAQHILSALNRQDTFRLVAFSNQTTEFHADALPATPENIAAGEQFVRRIHAGGGTNMLPALKVALKSDRGEEGRPRYLVLLSDALVGNDDRILGYLKTRAFDNTRIFPIAIGAAPNHYLIRRAAEIGRSFSMYVTNQDNAAEMAKRFNHKTSTPYLTDLEIDWGKLKVEDVIPSPLPDLYADEPLVVTARYAKPGTSEVTLRGNLAGQAVSMTMSLELPRKETRHDALGSVWARRRIRQIWNQNVGKETSKAEEEITRLGLDHQLVTRYTSFVAVEKERPSELTGKLVSDAVPTVLPEGMTGKAAPPQAFKRQRPRTTSPQPRSKPVFVQRAPETPRRSPASTPPRNEPPRRRSSGGGGFGGAVEWAFLAGLGLLGGARVLRRRRDRRAY